MTRIAAIPFVPLPLPPALAGRNTVEGFGQDVQAGGQALEETAEEAERESSD